MAEEPDNHTLRLLREMREENQRMHTETRQEARQDRRCRDCDPHGAGAALDHVEGPGRGHSPDVRPWRTMWKGASGASKRISALPRPKPWAKAASSAVCWDNPLNSKKATALARAFQQAATGAVCAGSLASA